MSDLPADAPAPRHCCIVKWPDFDGYGFNLHAEKSKPGQFIGKVDEGSPAEAAGLRSGDRIVEVNGVNIANENHKQVVERIKAVLNETRLLVLDEAADRWYRDRKIVVKGSQSNVRHLEAPLVRPSSRPDSPPPQQQQQPPPPMEEEKVEEEPEQEDIANGVRQEDDHHDEEEELVVVPPPQQPQVEDEDEEEDDNESFKSLERGGSRNNSKNASANGSNSSTPSVEKRQEPAIVSVDLEESRLQAVHIADVPEIEDKDPESHVEKVTETLPEKPPTPAANHDGSNGSASFASPDPNPSPTKKSPPAEGESEDKLNLNMSVQEMRALLASRKRHDPKKDAMDLRQKHAIVQNM